MKWRVIQTQTVRTYYIVEANSADAAREVYDLIGEEDDFEVVETLTEAKPL